MSKKTHTDNIALAIKEIGQDVKAIKGQVTPKVVRFDPRYYKEFVGENYIQVGNVYMRAVEMRLAQFDTVEYTDEYDPINVAIPAEQWGDWNFGYTYPEIVPSPAFQDGTAYQLQEGWELVSVENAQYSSTEGSVFYDITADEIFITLRNPQVNYGYNIKMRLYKA